MHVKDDLDFTTNDLRWVGDQAWKGQLTRGRAMAVVFVVDMADAMDGRPERPRPAGLPVT